MYILRYPTGYIELFKNRRTLKINTYKNIKTHEIIMIIDDIIWKSYIVKLNCVDDIDILNFLFKLCLHLYVHDGYDLNPNLYFQFPASGNPFINVS